MPVTPEGHLAHVLEQTGASVRQLDYWTRRGYIHADDRGHSGSGVRRHWPDGEVAVAAQMKRLIDAGIVLDVAARLARRLANGRAVAWLTDDTLLVQIPVRQTTPVVSSAV